MISADSVSWEANYGNEILREADGAKYGDIERGRLVSFRVSSNGTALMEIVPDCATYFVYRRRTMMQNEYRRVQFLIGNYPRDDMLPDGMSNGSVLVFDVNSGRIFSGEFGQEHPIADFSLPVPIPEEGEMF